VSAEGLKNSGEPRLAVGPYVNTDPRNRGTLLIAFGHPTPNGRLLIYSFQQLAWNQFDFRNLGLGRLIALLLTKE
jgi:hypothetical protein